jgi:hypothetical protein
VNGHMAVPVRPVEGVAPRTARKVVTPAPHPRWPLPADVDVVGLAGVDVDDLRLIGQG